MAARYIFRLDDIAPNMHWENFQRLQGIFNRFGVKPLLGVIPDNQDPWLLQFPAGPGDFWDEMRRLRNQGWEIAQHGYQHRYVTKSGGLLGLNRNSEFAGLSYDVQYAKLREGQQILRTQGLPTPTFMAPSHSFDGNTLRALRDLGFTTVTDGFALAPYVQDELLFVPQLTARPMKMPFGIHTFCLHPNTMGRAALDQVETFVAKHREQIIAFSHARQFVSRGRGHRYTGALLKLTLNRVRNARRLLSRAAP